MSVRRMRGGVGRAILACRGKVSSFIILRLRHLEIVEKHMRNGMLREEMRWLGDVAECFCPTSE